MFLHAHNFLNDIIAYQFDFNDEEIAENYMSWLKGLATRLSSDVLQYYFTKGTCPLLLQAQRFFTYPEAMTRTAARTVALCLFKTKHHDIVRIASEIGFFTHFICHIRKQWFDIDRMMCAGTAENSTKLQIAIDEQIDHLYYLNDLCDVGHTALMNAIGEELLKQLILPMIAGSLGVTGSERGAVSIQLAEFMFVQIVTVLKHHTVVNGLIAAVFLREISPELLQLCVGEIPPAPLFLSYSDPTSVTTLMKPDLKYSHSPKQAKRTVIQVLDWIQGLSQLPSLVPNPIRAELITFLRSKDDNLLILTCSALSALLSSQEIQRSLLVASGLLPGAQAKAQALYAAVLAELEEAQGPSIPLDDEVITLLLSILAAEPPFRLTTIALVCQVLLTLGDSLTIQHIQALNPTLLAAFQRVNLLKIKSFYMDCFVDLFEEERDSVLKTDLKSRIPLNIHHLLPLSEEETAKLPLSDRAPNGEIEVARRDIHMLLLLLKLKTLLRGDTDRLTVVSTVPQYQKGKSYPLQDVEITHCGLKQGQTSLPHLLPTSPSFFILALPTPHSPGHFTISLITSLRQVEAMVDRSDPRTLVLALKQGADSLQVELEFQSTQVCCRVKKDIDERRKTAKADELERTEEMLQTLERGLAGN